MTYTCSVCKYEKTESIHPFADAWSSDATNHWYAATCGHDVKADEAAHIFNEGEVIKEPTATEEGIKIYTCSVCKFKKIEFLAPHVHTFETTWTSDEANHWHKATCSHDVKADEAAHTFDEGVVTKAATEAEKTYTCTVCKYEKTESIPVHTHTFGEAVVTKAATETEEGVKTYTCTVCNYQKTEPIEKIIKITSISIPTAGTLKENNTVTATITGINFTSESVNAGMYSLTCTTDSIINGSVFTYVSESEINVTLTIPLHAASYDVTITNGTSSANGTFVVKDYRRVAVGDIIYTDGTTSSKDAELTSGQKPVAVVAGFNTNGAIVGLGLKQSSSTLKWAPKNTTGYKTKFIGIIAYSDKKGEGAGSTATITGDTDGSDNWEYVKSRDPKGTADAETNYPAFNFAATYATTAGITGEIAEGWYMPSLAELCELYKNKDTLNTSLSKCSGTQFRDDSYWSSSLTSAYSSYAWLLGFSYASLSSTYYASSYRDIINYVCCVRAF